ncbi:MAG: Gfo/Idh/MocA family oxidoreductase [Caldilineales bacterium]|nr:Gfo/Idh/MocA family oxidoreductase [Caldilineales bacterium]MCW5859811.1 Gfo/Idh/MocA family oxidoreductase [Caldilineales bacterium]
MVDPILELNYKPVLPPKIDYGLGLVGCGGIVQYAAMPSYRKHKLRVVAAYDKQRPTAEIVAQEFQIPHVYDSVEELVANPDVDIVEISVPPKFQPAIAHTCIEAGKHLLCQKPLALTLAEAAGIVEHARQKNVKVAVNQQLRWGQGIRAAKDLIKKGWIGQPVDASIQVSVNTPWNMWDWLYVSPRLEVQFHSIHYIDAMRALFGDPVWVTSRHARNPLQGTMVGETKTITILDYGETLQDNELQVFVADNHYNQSDDYFAIFRIIGTDGHITGTLGAMYNYPHGREDTLEWSSKRFYKDKRFEAKLEGKWIPDAFIGPTASLMQAIQEDGAPETDAADNLNTLRIVEACYVSAAEHRSVRLDELPAVSDWGK